MNYKFEYWYNKLEITKIVYVKKQLLELANFDSLNLLGFLYRNEKRFLFVLLKGTNQASLYNTLLRNTLCPTDLVI